MVNSRLSGVRFVLV